MIWMKQIDGLVTIFSIQIGERSFLFCLCPNSFQEKFNSHEINKLKLHAAYREREKEFLPSSWESREANGELRAAKE